MCFYLVLFNRLKFTLFFKFIMYSFGFSQFFSLSSWKRVLVLASLMGSKSPDVRYLNYSFYLVLITSWLSLPVVVKCNSYNILLKCFIWSFKGCECLVWVLYDCGLIIWGFICLGSIALIFILVLL